MSDLEIMDVGNFVGERMGVDFLAWSFFWLLVKKLDLSTMDGWKPGKAGPGAFCIGMELGFVVFFPLQKNHRIWFFFKVESIGLIMVGLFFFSVISRFL